MWSAWLYDLRNQIKRPITRSFCRLWKVTPKTGKGRGTLAQEKGNSASRRRPDDSRGSPTASVMDRFPIIEPTFCSTNPPLPSPPFLSVSVRSPCLFRFDWPIVHQKRDDNLLSYDPVGLNGFINTCFVIFERKRCKLNIPAIYYVKFLRNCRFTVCNRPTQIATSILWMPGIMNAITLTEFPRPRRKLIRFNAVLWTATSYLSAQEWATMTLNERRQLKIHSLNVVN